MNVRPELCVVHLARHVNGWEPFDRFLASYADNPAGIAHELLVVLKGHEDPGTPDEYRERVAPYGGTVLVVDDTGFDLGSYWAAARAVSATSFCFLNSFSVILGRGWLEKMARHHGPQVGIVGASGSWESHTSGWNRHLRRGLLLPPWRVAPEGFPRRRLTVRDRAWLVKQWLRQIRGFPRFPNPHIRTNAFMMRRELMLEIDPGPLQGKRDVLLFESGRQSLTRQVTRRGLDILVVGRDAVAYAPQDWPESHTFRSGEQSNLLVADNRTDEWLVASPSRRHETTLAAWGRVPG